MHVMQTHPREQAATQATPSGGKYRKKMAKAMPPRREQAPAEATDWNCDEPVSAMPRATSRDTTAGTVSKTPSSPPTSVREGDQEEKEQEREEATEEEHEPMPGGASQGVPANLNHAARTARGGPGPAQPPLLPTASTPRAYPARTTTEMSCAIMASAGAGSAWSRSGKVADDLPKSAAPTVRVARQNNGGKIEAMVLATPCGAVGSRHRHPQDVFRCP